MSVHLVGHWRITVQSLEPGPARRLVIQGSASGDGTFPATVGTTAEVHGQGDLPWSLNVQSHGPAGWQDSGLRLEGPVSVSGGTDVVRTLGSEDDPASTEAIWDDAVLQLRDLDDLIDLPVRPYALRTDDLQMMPDGIFDTALGHYYMGVRVRNTWGADFAAGTHRVGITPASRAWLAAAGIQILDTWSPRELESFGQTLDPSGHHVVLPALSRRAAHTVFFKLDCGAAGPGKYEVELECVEPAMVDPASPRRRARHKIFVSRSVLDTANREMRITCPEGTLKLKVRRFAAPVPYILRHRKRVSTAAPRLDKALAADELRHLLRALEAGRGVDPCAIERLLACACDCRGPGGRPDDPGNRRSGRFLYPDFPIIPVEFSYSVEGEPFAGALGPLAFEDPWWKVLLLIIAIILSIAAALSDASDDAYHDSDLVIGELDRWQQNDVDAALTKLNGKRGLPSPDRTESLDAQTGESFTSPISALDGDVSLNANLMTKAEIAALIASGTPAQLAVFKSGGRSGLTHGKIFNLTMPFTRPDDGTVFNLPQLLINQDPAFNEPTSQHGDSGSIWVQTQSLRMIALNHSGSADDSGTQATASLLVDVAAALNVQFS